ncbi:MAG: hypothetical protein AB7D43_11460 [Sulfurimonadaceae bacterium]
MKYLLLITVLLLSGCSLKNYEHTEPKIFVIKSPKLKFADLGYLRYSDDSIELELFVAGNSIEKIAINHLICTSSGCMGKGGFNAEYLHASYPSDLLQNILLGKEIYGGRNKENTPSGFEQNIKDENVDIVYRVRAGASFFKDRKNNIIFNLKDTQLRIENE